MKLIFVLLSLISLTACASLTSKPPTATEGRLFDITTNRQTLVVVQTNTVTRTNEMVVTVTNVVGQVVFATNLVPVQVPQIVLVTNAVDSYQFTPRQVATDTAGAVGAITNTFLPGVGSVVSTVLVGLLGFWARARTKAQGNQLAANLTQAIETARSVIKSLPNGAAVGAKFDAFLMEHQEDADLLKQIAPIVDQFVNPDQAQGAATKIIQLATTPLTPPAPVAAAPSNG